MKFAIPLQQFRKCMILLFLGITCSVTSYVLYIINPAKIILDYKLQMAPGSIVYELWKKPPINIYLKLYIFNITNKDEFLNGEEKLKVEEIGPYVYQEILENTNVTWHENDTISYIPKRSVSFVPEMSIGDPQIDMVHAPNIPMLGISSSLRNAGMFVNYPLSSLISMLDSKAILNITVHDYLWGYEDPLVRLASGIVPNFINFRKFGLLDRMYDEGQNVVSMHVGKNKNMTDEDGRYLSVDTYNYKAGMSQWGYREGNKTYPENTVCNRVRGATEGELFPTNLDEHATFRVYRKAFCRAIPIVFKKKVWMENGFEGYLYSMPDNFLDPPDQNPDNACYCKHLDRCLKKGLSDMTPCYYTIPAAMSLPHFLNADPSLLEAVEGLHPDPEKHGTKVILQPTVGIPMKVNSRIQVNLVMQHTTYSSRTKPFNDMTVPLFWSDLDIPSMPSDIEFILTLALYVLPMVQTVFLWLLTITAITLIMLSVPAMLWTLNQQEPLPSDRRDSTDLRIPLNYGQYTTMHILPAIKKITSKTDLFS